MPRSLLQRCVVGLLLLAASASPGGSAEPAGADPTWGHGQIRGTVVGTDDNVLIGISIVMLPRGNPHVAYATSTDDRGRYGFDNLLADRYQVRAEGQGFVPLFKEPVQVQPPFRAIVDIERHVVPGDLDSCADHVVGIPLPAVESTSTCRVGDLPCAAHAAQRPAGKRQTVAECQLQ